MVQTVLLEFAEWMWVLPGMLGMWRWSEGVCGWRTLGGEGGDEGSVEGVSLIFICAVPSPPIMSEVATLPELYKGNWAETGGQVIRLVELPCPVHQAPG